MVFAVWFFVWLAVAVAPIHLVLPLAALVVRAAYVEQRLPRLNVFVVVVWVAIALMTIPSTGTSGAMMFFLRLLLSGSLAIHLIARLGRSRLRRVPYVRDVLFQTSRVTSILSVRLREIGYWISVRRRDLLRTGHEVGVAGKIAHRLRMTGPLLRLYGVAAYSWLLELLFQKSRLALVIEVRGDTPKSSDWIHAPIGPQEWVLIALADVGLFFVATLPSREFGLVPEIIASHFPFA